jgi:prepilin-type N-terminal cleavage/methylation domain-containing protein
MNTHKGFSLVELLIVVVIIGILAALAVTGLMASRRSANEGSTVSSLRLLHGAQMTYSTSFGLGEFAGSVGAGTTSGLTILRGYELIDPVLGSGSKSGYNYVGARVASSGATPAQFFFSSIPVSSSSVTGTGIHRFGISTDGVMRQDSTVASHYADVTAVSAASPMGN